MDYLQNFCKIQYRFQEYYLKHIYSRVEQLNEQIFIFTDCSTNFTDKSISLSNDAGLYFVDIKVVLADHTFVRLVPQIKPV